MAQIVISFDSEAEAREAMELLSQAEIGEVRARVLESSEPLGHPKKEHTSPMITPGLGSVEVRPSETPQVPEAMVEDSAEDMSAAVSTDESGVDGVQVMIEVDDAMEDEVWRILGLRKPDASDFLGE